MKRVIYLFFMALFLFCSCSQNIDELLQTITDQEERVEQLEKWREQMNGDIELLKKFHTAIQKKDFVVSVTPLTDGSGYKLVFMEGGSVIIRNGKTGETGDAGAAPILTVIEDGDGKSYWGQVVDGKTEFLLDGTGHKVLVATDVEVKAPIMGINGDGFWTVDLSDGLGPVLMRNNAGDPVRATAVQPLIVRIDVTEDRVVLFLSDGKQITFPVNDAFTLSTYAWQCFFEPMGNLSALLGPLIDDKTTERFLNGSREVEYVNRWERLNDTILWGINIPAAGRVFVTPIMGVLPAQAGSTIEVKLAGQSQIITTVSTGALATFGEQPSAGFVVSAPGFYQLNLVLKSRKVNGTVGYVKGCDLRGGAAMQGASIELKRWRPEAHHYGFGTTTGANDFVIMIIEEEVLSPEVATYSPVTTPYGYSGVGWDAGARQFSGINFSLWRDNTPDHTKWSHMIAVGRGHTFGAFDHEGSGVKPRGPNPYAGYKINRTAIAVTKHHGVPFTRYATHYLNPATGKDWLLFGVANDFTGQTNKSYLSVGGFIEITGNAVATRTGHHPRVLRYRGWGIRENGAVVPMDQFSHQVGSWYSNKNAYIDNENYFVASAGGWGVGSVTNTPLVLTKEHELPEFMSPEKIKALVTMPAIVRGVDIPVEVTSTSVKVTIVADALGTNPVGEIYWGTTDELTFADNEIKKYAQWQNRKIVSSVATGNNTYEITELLPATKYYWRFSVKNNEGLTWIDNTYSFTTNP